MIATVIEDEPDVYSYSAEEWEEIQSSLLVLGAALSNEDKFSIMLGQAEKLGDREMHSIYTDASSEVSRSIADIKRLRSLYCDDPSFSPFLPELIKFQKYLHSHQSGLARIATLGPGPARPPNERRFAQSLMNAAATIWMRRGGCVNQGKDYRRFFEAVVRPVLSSPTMIQRHHCAWSDGMFITHARAKMKSHGASGTRGRKRQ